MRRRFRRLSKDRTMEKRMGIDKHVIRQLREPLRAQNSTLRAAVELSRPRHHLGRKPIARAVVTYNYDNLLEMALPPGSFEPIWSDKQQATPGPLPIYHVHGYVPVQGNGSGPDE